MSTVLIIEAAKQPGPWATEPPSDIERLETTMRLHHEWAAKNIGNLRDTLQTRVAGTDYQALKRGLREVQLEMANLRLNFSGLPDDMSLANRNIDALDEQAVRVSKRIDDLTRRCDEATNSRVQAHERIAALERQRLHDASEITKLRQARMSEAIAEFAGKAAGLTCSR